MLQDIATLTGATVDSEEAGRKLDSASMADLGRAGQVRVTKELTTIVDGLGDKDVLLLHVLLKSVHKFRKPLLISIKKNCKNVWLKLAGGVAVIKVGAATEAELKDKKLRIEECSECYPRCCCWKYCCRRGTAFAASTACSGKNKSYRR